MSRLALVLAGGVAGVLAVLTAAAVWRLTPPGRVEPAATLSVAEALRGGSTEGYARALTPRPFVFPDDHGPHPAYRTEWWYFTGNLATGEGRHLGYQLTFFRSALAATVPARRSGWAVRDVYMAHLAITDTAGRRFHASQRFARGAAGLAGASAHPFRVWLEDWSLESLAPGGFPARLRAAEGDVALDLVVDAGKPVVLQGERGLSRKGPEPGNASHYYSLTRMRTRGTIRVGGRPLDVRGTSWMDREWSTSALGDQVGWDWFALQLADGREVMFYSLRRADGSPDPISAGVVVAPDGRARPLGATDVRIEVTGTWTSPRGGSRYPARWRVQIPREALHLDLVPTLEDQEFPGPFRYWEGAVRVRPVGNGPEGVGYVELVGYADPARVTAALDARGR